MAKVKLTDLMKERQLTFFRAFPAEDRQGNGESSGNDRETL